MTGRISLLAILLIFVAIANKAHGEDNCCDSDCDNFRKGRACIKVEYSIGSGATLCKCTGWEQGTAGPGPRKLDVNCNNRGNRINCVYRGQPHECSKYNGGKQKEFYQEALNNIAAKICSLPSSNLICPKGTVDTLTVCHDLEDKFKLKFYEGDAL